MDNHNTFSMSYYKKNKIDKENKYNLDINCTIMKPKYSTNEELMCGVIE